MRPIHRPRRRTLEVDAFGIVAAAVTGALELVLTRLPVRRAPQMRTDRRDHEDTLGVPHDPDAVLVLKLGVHAEAEIGGIADREAGLRLIQSARQKEAQEHDEVHAQKSQHRGHNKTTPASDLFPLVGVFLAAENLLKRFGYSWFSWLWFKRRWRCGATRLFSGRIRHLCPRDSHVRESAFSPNQIRQYTPIENSVGVEGRTRQACYIEYWPCFRLCNMLQR